MKNENIAENKMAKAQIKHLLLRMGLPMIVSMVLQALYNVVDSVFVTNMGELGATANQALTVAFPIQILIIAIGVGTGIGINALLSKKSRREESRKGERGRRKRNILKPMHIRRISALRTFRSGAIHISVCRRKFRGAIDGYRISEDMYRLLARFDRLHGIRKIPAGDR